VVTWQGRQLLGPCLDSLRAQTVHHDVIVVDNASTDGTGELLDTAYPEVTVVSLPTNTGFAGGVAAALPLVDTRFLALLNNDAVADPGWLAAAVSTLDARAELAAVSSRILLFGEPARINNTGIELRQNGYGADRGLGDPDGPAYDEEVEVFGASGGAAVYRTLAVKAVGGVEPRFFLYYEDTDLSWRLRLAGWAIGYCPDALVHHRHGATSGPGSPWFAFHNERNRLLLLLRCAPLSFVGTQALRYVLTTASLALARALGRPLPPDGGFSPALRIRALASAAALAPRLMTIRSSTHRHRRAQVLREWRATSSRPLGARPVRR
jgi:GT2 family glycosyltransferase